MCKFLSIKKGENRTEIGLEGTGVCDQNQIQQIEWHAEFSYLHKPYDN